jgi:hypothetical protein
MKNLHDSYCYDCPAQYLCAKMGPCEVIRGFLPVKPHLTYNKRLKLARSRGLNLAKWLPKRRILTKFDK